MGMNLIYQRVKQLKEKYKQMIRILIYSVSQFIARSTIIMIIIITIILTIIIIYTYIAPSS